MVFYSMLLYAIDFGLVGQNRYTLGATSVPIFFIFRAHQAAKLIKYSCMGLTVYVILGVLNVRKCLEIFTLRRHSIAGWLFPSPKACPTFFHSSFFLNLINSYVIYYYYTYLITLYSLLYPCYKYLIYIQYLICIKSLTCVGLNSPFILYNSNYLHI